MADTCFADYSALGSGLNDYDNELTEAPEEEEDFDVLNDETFGDIGGDDFPDWEEQTEKFAEGLDQKYRHDHTHDSGFSTAEKTYRSQEEYMEQSINQLMVDDDDVQDDPAIVNVRKAKPIPRKQQSLDMLFGPSSPPSLLDTEYLVSPTSKNIWGSPVAVEPKQPKHLNNIQSLFDFAKLANADLPVAHIHGPHSQAPPMMLPKAQTLEEIENAFLQKPRVMTAEDLERQLRGESNTPPKYSMPNGHPPRPPSQFTVPPPNIIESPQNRSMPPPMMPPPGLSPSMLGMNGHNGSAVPGSPFTAGPGYRATASTPINRQSPVFDFSRRSPLLRTPTPPPMGVACPGTPPPMGVGYPRTPSPLGMAYPRTPTLPVIPRFVTPYASPSMSAPRYIATPGRGLSQPIGIPHAMKGPAGSPFNSPQGMYGSPQGAFMNQQHRMPQYGSYPNDQSFNRNNYNNNINTANNIKYQSPQGKGMYHKDGRQSHYRVDNRGDHPQREHRYHRPPFNQKHEGMHERGGAPHGINHLARKGSREEDEYNGLMTQKEKDWIIKIQLLQLQTENPLLDDYYYTVICLKKQAKEREKKGDGKDDGSRLVIPAMARLENRSYKPAQFEGSLGRLTTSSVHNPRQIIDLLAKSVSETAATHKVASKVGKELRKSRQLLMDIEKGYNILLMIEDLEKQILALPEDMRKPLLEERQYRIDILFHYLLCDGDSATFMQNMNVRKGRSLTMRALPLLDKVQSVGIVSLICKNLQQIMKKDQPDENLQALYWPCAKVIESCNLATIVMYVEDIQQEESQSSAKPIALALQNKFGCSVLCALLHRGEEIYSSTSIVDMDTNLQDEWTGFVQDFASLVATVPSESVVAPLEPFSDITNHLQRLLSKRLLSIVEDNLRVFTHPATENES